MVSWEEQIIIEMIKEAEERGDTEYIEELYKKKREWIIEEGNALLYTYYDCWDNDNPEKHEKYKKAQDYLRKHEKEFLCPSEAVDSTTKRFPK